MSSNDVCKRPSITDQNQDYTNGGFTSDDENQLSSPADVKVFSTDKGTYQMSDKEFVSSNEHHHQGTATKKSTSNCESTFSCCEITFLLIGALLVNFGFAMLVGGYQAMFHAILKSQMEIRPGSKAYGMWKVTPVPLYLHVYFFNLTNPFYFKRGKVPIMQEVGPYCYCEYHEKQNVTFHDNHTVTYFQERWWTWDQECSGNNTKDDVIVTLNVVAVSAAWSVRHVPVEREGLNLLMKKLKEKLVIKATASQIMFDGIEDPLLDWIQKYIIPEDAPFHYFMKYFPPDITLYDKFGWFYGRNHSLIYDGIFNMKTGTDSLDKVGQIDLWNHSRSTRFFDAPCNRVTGSAGEIFSQNLKKTFIEFYSSDLCMSMKLYYKEETEESHGLTGYRYWGNQFTFSNGSTLPGNECFCVKGTCAPYGLLNAQSCRLGSPTFISFPHFFNADQFLLHQVKGLHPEEEKHAFTLDLIPEIGVPMHVEARMQVNVFVRPYIDEETLFNETIGGIDIMKNVKELYMPLMWFEEIASAPDDFAGQLKTLLFIIRTPTMTIIFSIILVLGVFAIAIVLWLHWQKIKYAKTSAAVTVKGQKEAIAP